MALTETEKASLRLYLGWSERFHQTDSRLEQAFSGIDALGTTDAVTTLRAELAQLADLDSRMTQALARIQVAEVGTIKLMRGEELMILRSEGRRIVGRIETTLGVSKRHDVFSSASSYSFAGAHGLYPDGDGGGSNLPPLG